MRNRDDVHLGKLRDYYARNGVFPPFSGIAKLVGLKSTSAVSVLVGRLKDAGFLVSTPDRRLAPGPRFYERPEACTAVRAGSPEMVLDVADSPVLIDKFLVDTPSRTVILPVKGDSMRDAGLLDGDRLIVKRGDTCQNGDIVVAIVDDEFTVKYLAKDAQGFYLKPGNAAFDDIRPQYTLELFGRVTGCFRIY